jgi:NAD(P)-dependent dehydrogenase (short-subunit alcohol dehydrogenase family)
VELAGSVALVTGGARGIGRAIADALRERGALVVVADLEDGDVRIDLTAAGAVEQMISETARRHGRIDVLVNNAGGYDEPTFPEADEAHWRQTLELNLGAVMLATQRVLPIMEAAGGGTVLNVASTAALGRDPYAGVDYAVAKAGVIRLTTALRRPDVRVNCLCPHTVATKSLLRALESRPLAELAPPPATLVPLYEVVQAALRLIEDESASGETVVLWGSES